jgi:hypothetical protein
MQRPLIMLSAVVVLAVGLFLGAYHLTGQFCACQMGRSLDDLDWLRMEFNLTPVELARIRELHQAYLPRCRDFCRRIQMKKDELRNLLESGDGTAPAMETKLKEIASLRAQCQTTMLQHFHQVSLAMPLAQSKRYLSEMTRLTLGFHDQMEASMSAPDRATNAHD